VASGQVFAPSSGPTRTEADFVEHVRRTIATDPTALRGRQPRQPPLGEFGALRR